ncbi:hypothetical protein ABIB00_007604, partial [Bradyrhizobium sp. LB14.3]
ATPLQGREQQQLQALVVHPFRKRPSEPRKARRRTYPCTTPLLTPNMRAMTRSVRPWCLKRRTSLIRRIDNLWVGISFLIG